jgi:hypothetical protein
MNNADQLMAADAQATRLMTEAAGRLADAGSVVVPLPVSPFHRRLLARMYAALGQSIENGEPTTCAHVDLRTPCVVYWDAARPGVLVCGVCTTMTPTGEAECALCGEAGTRNLFIGGHRLPVTFPVAQVIARWILCMSCMTADYRSVNDLANARGDTGTS